MKKYRLIKVIRSNYENTLQITKPSSLPFLESYEERNSLYFDFLIFYHAKQKYLRTQR